MRTRQARLRQITKAQNELELFDLSHAMNRKPLDANLGDAFRSFVAEYPGSLRELARRTGFSVAYLSDVTRRRRAVSGNLINALHELK